MVIALIALLGTAALVMDVGFAYYAKRQVQAQADAAALAGAQQLPDITSATSVATQYSNLNLPNNMAGESTPVITTRCSTSSAAWCGSGKTFQANTIAVTETGTSPTWFSRVLGFTNFNVSGTATACQPCSSAPVDIMLVIDRTGSMCQPQGPGGSCTDLDNAKLGVQTLLGIMDPNIDTIGLVAFPPYASGGSNPVCSSNTVSTLSSNGLTAHAGNYDSSSLTYLDDPLASTFKTSAASALNPASTLVQHMTTDTSNSGASNCPDGIQSFGSTSYDDALRAAQAELVKDGRKGVPKFIVFMTDGEANLGSFWGLNDTTGHGLETDLADPSTNFNMSPVGSSSTVNPGDAQPCLAAINAANTIKAAGTTIYTIGYGLLNPASGTYQNCTHGVWGDIDESNASSDTDYKNFKCVAIGTTLTGKNKSQSWADGGAGHWQGLDPAPAPDVNNQNPCTNSITGSHAEIENSSGLKITSYTTLQSIASTGDFYNQASTGDVTQIFAAIAADITKGTSRLVDDGY
jgi:Putative Flp pilus-assembly TadE/G-like